ncbi:MAG: GCN5-related N-acetyltransferase [Herbinix sp.]|jgi:ribosomal-protein-alanine N-acetyltransferase|nr:GCN5-related N-acetyltransferase [Herbinix sp.]
MIHLETERLILRNYRTEDFQDCYDYFSTEEVSRYEDFSPMSEDEVKELIHEWENEDNRLVVELKDKHIVIGSIGYFVDDDGDYSMDYDFNPIYGRKGYATEAGEKLLLHLFNTIGVKEVYGDCDINNINSWKLLERLGFKRIKQISDVSYKEDSEGNPILISIYLYKIEKQ